MKIKKLFSISFLAVIGLCSCGQDHTRSSATLSSVPTTNTTTAATNPGAVPAAPVASPASIVVEAPTPVALIYPVQGACPQSCIDAATQLAVTAGLSPQLVTPNLISTLLAQNNLASLFQNVATWIQPGGGVASNLINAMPTLLQDALKIYLQGGGGYAGIDAGALIATRLLGNTGIPGLGIFPGAINTHSNSGSNTGFLGGLLNPLESLFSAVVGPVITGLENLAQPVGLNPDQTVAAAKALFGQGRIFISTIQPTTPTAINVVTEMLKWTASTSGQAL